MTPQRKAVVSVVSAVMVLVVVTVIILVFGVIPLPDYPSLADQPDPSIPGTVAYATFGEDSGVFSLPAGGGESQKILDEWIEFGPAFTTEGQVAVGVMGGGPSFLTAVIVDPETGREVDRVDAPVDFDMTLQPDRSRRDDGARVTTSTRGKPDAVIEVRYPDGRTETILETPDAPEDYWFDFIQWSPDGQWVLAVDSDGRILIMGATGTPSPRLLVDTDADWMQPAWYIPGNTTYTVEIAGR